MCGWRSVARSLASCGRRARAAIATARSRAAPRANEGEGRRTCLAGLLAGLGDADTGLQQLVIDFLTSSTLLPTSSLELATSLLTTFHVESKEAALVTLLPMALLTTATRATTRWSSTTVITPTVCWCCSYCSREWISRTSSSCIWSSRSRSTTT